MHFGWTTPLNGTADNQVAGLVGQNSDPAIRTEEATTGAATQILEGIA
jgi:hypothetical protein